MLLPFFLLPALVAAQTPTMRPPPTGSPPPCCPKKMVGSDIYLYAEKSSETRDYDCVDPCVYTLEGTERRFCFALGDDDVQCMREEVTPVSMPTGPASTTPAKPATTPKGSATTAPTPATTPKGSATTAPTTSCKCGLKKSQRIVNGQDSGKNEWPWMTSMSYKQGLQVQHSCGASLISEEWFVTAAHCFHDQTGKVDTFANEIAMVIGEHDLSTDLETSLTEKFDVEKIVIHSDYDHSQTLNDIALVKVTKKVDLTKHTPVCLPPPNKSFEGKQAWAYGWGALQYGGKNPDILQEAELPVVSLATCKTAMANFDAEIVEGMVCAGGNNKDACQGDSGGPLTVSNANNQHELVGATSWGIDCNKPGAYGVWADVSYYIPWINTNINNNGGATYCPA